METDQDILRKLFGNIPETLSDKLLWERNVNQEFQRRELEFFKKIAELQIEVKILKDSILNTDTKSKKAQAKEITNLINKLSQKTNELQIANDKWEAVKTVLTQSIKQFVEQYPPLVVAHVNNNLPAPSDPTEFFFKILKLNSKL